MTKRVNKSTYVGAGLLEILDGAVNYNKWISENFTNVLNSPLLEIGAGTGNISKFFLGQRPFYISDVDEHMVRELKKKYSKDSRILKIDITKKPPEKFKLFFGSILGVNVLEHIEEDEKALSNLNQFLKENGKLGLLVPAKKWFYTKLDAEIGHFRRYEKKELIAKLETSGFAVEKIYFFNLLGLLSWKIRDKIQKEIYMSQNQVQIFDSIVPFLRRLEGFIKPPLGISLIVIARKIRSVS